MISSTLSLWGNGAVTLPKKWREQFHTKNFLAEETPEGYLLIKPIMDFEYYEEEDGSFGLRFPMGMDMNRFIELWDQADQKLRAEKKKLPRRRGKRHG